MEKVIIKKGDKILISGTPGTITRITKKGIVWVRIKFDNQEPRTLKLDRNFIEYLKSNKT